MWTELRTSSGSATLITKVLPGTRKKERKEKTLKNLESFQNPVEHARMVTQYNFRTRLEPNLFSGHFDKAGTVLASRSAHSSCARMTRGAKERIIFDEEGGSEDFTGGGTFFPNLKWGGGSHVFFLSLILNIFLKKVMPLSEIRVQAVLLSHCLFLFQIRTCKDFV